MSNTAERPRPETRTTRSTGWSWPRLVDVQKQKAKAAPVKRSSAAPRHSSTAPSICNQRRSCDMSALSEEQLALTSPTVSPGGSESAFIEGSDNAGAINDKLEPVEVAEEPVSKHEGGDDEHDGHLATDEGGGEDDEGAKLPDVISNANPLNLDAVSTPEESLPSTLSTVVDADATEAESTPKQQTVVLEMSPVNRRVSISEHSKALPPPKIMIHKPSDTSDADETPPPPVGTPELRTIDVGLFGEWQALTQVPQEDRDIGIQDDATDIAAVSPRPMPGGVSKASIDLKVKRKSMVIRKARTAIVRGPILKILLGRQLAGPTKKALKKRAIGQDVALDLPVIPDTVVVGMVPRI